MVLYEAMILVSAKAPRTACADVLRRLGTRVLDTGGVVTDVASYGARTLAYEFRRPGEKHFEVRRRASRRVVRRSCGGCGGGARERGRAGRARVGRARERERAAKGRARGGCASSRRDEGCERECESVRERVTDGGDLWMGRARAQAQFVKMTFNAPPSVVADAERALRLDERVLRWIFTKQRALKRLNDFKARDPRNPNTIQSYSGRK